MPFAEQRQFPILVRQGRSRARYKVGYIDRSGKPVIEPQFDDGDCFSEGLAAIKLNKKWGFIDSKGDRIIEPRFIAVAHFYEGLAAACGGPQKWGYVDFTGHFTIPAQYMIAGDFSEGLAWIRKGEGLEGFVDREGRVVVPPIYQSVRSHSEGLAPVQIGGLWGYIDQEGEMVISPQFAGDLACPFLEGLSRVKHGGRYGFIDRSGKWVIEPRFPFALDFHEGWALVGKSFEELTGYITPEGDLKIRLSDCVSAKQFSEGLAAVTYPDGSTGFIDASGELAIPARYESTRPFCSGLAAVTTESSIGYINHEGAFVWEGPWVQTGFFIRPIPLALQPRSGVGK
ncbi:MAG: WG repeat-containing protein [Bryobacterales bacterium]